MFQFRPLSEAHLETVRKRVGAAAAAWSSEWVNRSLVAQVTVESARVIDVSPNTVWKKHEALPIYVLDSNQHRARLVRLLSGEAVSGETPPVLARWSSLALEALLAEIAGQGAHLVDLEVIPDECVRECSGYVMCTLGLGDLSLVVVADAFLSIFHASADKPHQSKQTLSLRADAIVGVPVHVDVQLRHTSIEVQQLVALSVGDVIELEHDLSQPLHVVAPGNVRLGQAYLGKVGATKAITPIKSN